ncbi:hypothetical protein L9F63_007840, partial [Diploptera punctata]
MKNHVLLHKKDGGKMDEAVEGNVDANLAKEITAMRDKGTIITTDDTAEQKHKRSIGLIFIRNRYATRILFLSGCNSVSRRRICKQFIR